MKQANEFQMWRELLICTFMQNQTHLGQILFTLVSKNKILLVIQQVQRQSLQMGQLVDFREENQRLSFGERNNELVPVHIPEVTQAYNCTLICFFLFL